MQQMDKTAIIIVSVKQHFRRQKMAKLEDIEGVGGTYAQKLMDAGITTTDALLQKGATPKGRKELAAATGIGDALILRWVNHCDLYRIKGIGSEFAELLEAVGVDTVPELAQRKADNLYQKLVEVNDAKKKVRKMPVQSQVAEWVDQAKKLDRVVNY
jgi:predicted flap endonuclease-1-like 5' DNA nuclease